MPTVRDMLQDGARRLRGSDARREAEILLGHVLGQSRAWLVAHAEDPVGARCAATFCRAIQRRAHGEPIAYITGVRGFHGLELQVTAEVLIPRPETELLVDLALERIPGDTDRDVADLGTGCGALALAIAKARPRVRIVASDASVDALQIARGNAEQIEARNVEFAQGHWCAALGDRRFDGIVSNPPYVAQGDPHLTRGDLRFEPRDALVSGVDGLDAIRVIVRDARKYLRGGGWLLFEHGYDQGRAARRLLLQHGYAQIFSARDLAARERVSGGNVVTKQSKQA